MVSAYFPIKIRHRVTTITIKILFQHITCIFINSKNFWIEDSKSGDLNSLPVFTMTKKLSQLHFLQRAITDISEEVENLRKKAESTGLDSQDWINSAITVTDNSTVLERLEEKVSNMSDSLRGKLSFQSLVSECLCSKAGLWRVEEKKTKTKQMMKGIDNTTSKHEISKVWFEGFLCIFEKLSVQRQKEDNQHRLRNLRSSLLTLDIIMLDTTVNSLHEDHSPYPHTITHIGKMTQGIWKKKKHFLLSINLLVHT